MRNAELKSKNNNIWDGVRENSALRVPSSALKRLSTLKLLLHLGDGLLEDLQTRIDVLALDDERW